MTDAPLAFAGLAGLARRLAAGELTARALTEHLLERIAALDPQARAFIAVTGAAARDRAAALDAGPNGGALHGLPYAVKDMFDVAGVETTAGSAVLADNVAREDATTVARMGAAGAICLGKLNQHEFAYGATGENPIHGTAVNPHDPTRLAGGSSSGSAAAVAWGLVPAALGTDTGGSVRAPAALCGLVGLKPTLGRIPVRGVLPYSWTLDHVGTVTHTVADAALLLGVLAGRDPGDPASSPAPVEHYAGAVAGAASLSGRVIGVPRRFFFEEADPEILAAAEAALRHLEAEGARIRDVEMPDMAETRTVSLTIQMPEALSVHMPWLEARGDRYGADFRAGLALGQCLLAEHYVRARRMLTRYRQAVDAVFEGVDALLTPAVPVIAPPVGAVTVPMGGRDAPAGNAITRCTSFFNMTGHPAVTVPAGLHSAGLPMGVQLVGRHFEEARLLAIAARLEGAPGFRIPPAAV